MNDVQMLEKIASLELQLSKIKEEVHLKDQCLALVAHDFSGVSRNLQWILNSLMDGDISYEIFKSLYPEIKDNIVKNNKTIESTLAWVKSQHQSYTMNPIEINLFELFSSIKALLKFDLERKNIDLSFQGSEKIEIRNDRVLLSFILKSILENAIKYSYAGSKVLFDLQQIENKNISLIIEDSGTGMSKQVVENLFTLNGSPYTGTLNEIGAGLSLVIAKDLLHLIGGSIEVTSEEKVGTKVELQVQNIL